MKLKTTLAALFSILVSFSSHGEWTEVYSEDNTDYYIDFDTIKQHNGMVYFWRLDDYFVPKQGSLSSEIYSKGSCSYNKAGILSVIDYKKSMGEGDGDSWNPEFAWHYLTPKDRLLSAVCKNIDDSFDRVMKTIGSKAY